MTNKILIKNGDVITMDSKFKESEKLDVLVTNGNIEQISADIEPQEGFKVIDASKMIVLPGLINSHIHTWQTGLRGLGSDWTATNYFRAMHAGMATFFQPKDSYIANLVGALNQINNGVTTLVDWHHNNKTPDHSDAAIDGLEESGIRAVFLHGTPKPDPKPGQKHFSEFGMPKKEVERLRKERFSNDDQLLTMGLAILGPQMATEQVSIEDFRLAKDLDIIASIHHSGLKMSAPSGYKMGAKENLLDKRINIVHGNELLEEDFQILKDAGATFTVTSEVEMQMSYGDPLSGRLVKNKIPFSIGTDIESAYAPDMFAAMRLTMQVERHLTSRAEQKITGERPHPIPVSTKDALSWATIHGANTFRLDKSIGSITQGKKADIILVRKNDLNLVGNFNSLNAIVSFCHPGNVDTVLINGNIVKENGSLKYNGILEKIDKLMMSGNRILKEFKEKSHTSSFL